MLTQENDSLMASPKRKLTTIDEYLADANPDQRRTLNKLRAIVRAAAPEAQECISYGIPAFRLNGRPLVFFAAWTNHCSLYPGNSVILKHFRDDLKDFEIRKGTIRFLPNRPLPIALVKKLVKARVADVTDSANKNRSKP
jgi:uncharacterized protein YdhG (YjbR/CyaY superfamily)